MTRALRRLGITALFASSLLVSCLLLSCAYPGTTSRTGITLRQPPQSTPLRPITVRQVQLNYSGVRLIDLGLFPNSVFNAVDKSNFDASLKSTLKAATKWHEQVGDEIRVYVVIQRHVIGWYGEGNAALAAFAWCAADPAGKILFQEQFYATTRCTSLCNTGVMKDEINHAAIRRIAAKTLRLASGVGESESGSSAAPGTYDTVEGAIGSIAYVSPYMRIPPNVNFTAPYLKVGDPPDWPSIVVSGNPELAPQ
ncbi:hypothetical protein KP004_21045 [Geomonas oryzisoli]|uniref:DUF4136 domain-containing protein n=1 Tax=Geomonas oryzisoli TaxID=2847992 RepID=A0ABX8J922_9BACT|nr:hypothetical protein [Geomonas oryzisoli]QWV93611.1 hypothetical protein KP004_21045 [Geomonas oryzisoli]